jgi:hypothetical protein
VAENGQMVHSCQLKMTPVTTRSCGKEKQHCRLQRPSPSRRRRADGPTGRLENAASPVHLGGAPTSTKACQVGQPSLGAETPAEGVGMRVEQRINATKKIYKMAFERFKLANPIVYVAAIAKTTGTSPPNVRRGAKRHDWMNWLNGQR